MLYCRQIVLAFVPVERFQYEIGKLRNYPHSNCRGTNAAPSPTNRFPSLKLDMQILQR